jgi:SAM-dependent methyltransferase
MVSYRDEFDTPEKAHRYETVEYAESAYATILSKIEADLLRAEIEKLRRAKKHIDYLDFACGTGRIIALLEPYADTATGIDISTSMLALAARKTKKARIIAADITAAREIEGRYDFITAMRFFLNAEAPLRIAALAALAARLRDAESRLVINNHANLYSHKILLWPFHKFRELTGMRPKYHYLTRRQISRLADQTGLEIVHVHGYGQLSAKLTGLLPRKLIEMIESRLTDFPVLRNFGVNQIYVIRPRQ